MQGKSGFQSFFSSDKTGLSLIQNTVQARAKPRRTTRFSLSEAFYCAFLAINPLAMSGSTPSRNASRSEQVTEFRAVPSSIPCQGKINVLIM